VPQSKRTTKENPCAYPFFKGECNNYYNHFNNVEKFKITKLVRVGTSLGIIIPEAIRDTVGWKRGDMIALSLHSQKYMRARKIHINPKLKLIKY
jgi:hypothetical protein